MRDRLYGKNHALEDLASSLVRTDKRFCSYAQIQVRVQQLHSLRSSQISIVHRLRLSHFSASAKVLTFMKQSGVSVT